MTQRKCVIGGHPITTANDSEEHIVLNAAGGVRTTKGFICVKHNNETGTDWDAELASQLNGLCHIFSIKRDRGKTPDETVRTTADETFVMQRDGGFALPKPSIERQQIGSATHIRVKTRDMREARKILKGLKRQHPTLDVEAEIAKAQAESSYPAGMINIPVQIGGARAGRSIVKSAIALAHDSGIPATACEVALKYLQDEQAIACFGYYQSRDLIVGRPRGVPLHCVAIDGDPESGLLLGYVEYFGFLRMVALLSKAYAGEPIKRCYAIDPTSGQELNVSACLRFTLTEIEEIFAYKHCDHDDTTQNVNEVLGPALERKNKRDRDHVLNEAVRYALENCGAKEGEMLTPEHIAKVARLAAEKLAPYIMNLNRPRPAPQGTKFYPHATKTGGSQ